MNYLEIESELSTLNTEYHALVAKISAEESKLKGKNSETLKEDKEKLLVLRDKRQELKRQLSKRDTEYRRDWNNKQKAKILEILSEILGDESSEFEAQDKIKSYDGRPVWHLNSNNVLVVGAKTHRAKRLTLGFYTGDDYLLSEQFEGFRKNYENRNAVIVKFSSAYISMAMKLMVESENADGEFSVEIGVAKDFPITIENDDFIVHIAPRGDD